MVSKFIRKKRVLKKYYKGGVSISLCERTNKQIEHHKLKRKNNFFVDDKDKNWIINVNDK